MGNLTKTGESRNEWLSSYFDYMVCHQHFLLRHKTVVMYWSILWAPYSPEFGETFSLFSTLNIGQKVYFVVADVLLWLYRPAAGHGLKLNHARQYETFTEFRLKVH